MASTPTVPTRGQAVALAQAYWNQQIVTAIGQVLNGNPLAGVVGAAINYGNSVVQANSTEVSILITLLQTAGYTVANDAVNFVLTIS